jgi:hypothetical protein
VSSHQQEQHEMLLQGTQPSGADEWLCPTCGRRLVMRPPPDEGRVVLDPGDEYAIHVGGKGGVRIGQLAVSSTGSTEAEERAWREWLDSIGIQWDGPAA